MLLKNISVSLFIGVLLNGCSFFSDSDETRAAEYLCALELERPTKAKFIKIAQTSKLTAIEKQLNDLAFVPPESKNRLDRLHPDTMSYAVHGIQPKGLRIKDMPEADEIRSQNKAPMEFLKSKHPEYFDKCRTVNVEYLKCSREALNNYFLGDKTLDLADCLPIAESEIVIKGFENDERSFREISSVLDIVQKLLKNSTIYRKKTMEFYEGAHWENSSSSAETSCQEFSDLKVDINNSRDSIKEDLQAAVLITRLLSENTPGSFAEEQFKFFFPNSSNREAFLQVHFESLMKNLNFEDQVDYRSKKINFSSNPNYFLPLIFLLEQPQLKISSENKAKLTNRSFVTALAMRRSGLLLLKKIGKAVAPIPKLKNTFGHPLVFSTFRKDSLEGLKFFIDNGTPAQEVDKFGGPLLAKAVEVENMEKIKFLIGKGANPSFKVKKLMSKSALEVAKDLGNPGMINFLKSVK